MLCTLCYVFSGLVVVTVLTLALGWWMNGYFRRHGVQSPPAYLPFIGHMLSAITQSIHFKDFVHDAYKYSPGERYTGIIQFTRRLIVLKDIELIKQIGIKDFDHFVDHVSSSEQNPDSIFGNTLISLQGQKWRDMRATLSPAFTSSKIRGMFQLVAECGYQMNEYHVKLMDKTENKEKGMVEIELKDEFSRYANDVIATSAFGLKVDSFNDRNNEFFQMGKSSTEFSGAVFFKFMFLAFLPRLAKMLNMTFLPKKVTDFYRNLVWDTIKEREERNIIRPDMIHLLNEAKKGTLQHESNDDGKETGFATVEESAVGKKAIKREWTDDDIVAQAVLFLIAGFDTTATMLCFLVHELTIHSEVQKKLQEEIDEVADSLDGKLTYDALLKMKYMDMVVSEALRLWPPSPATDRKCVKSYVLPPPNDQGKPFVINENEGVWIPIYGIHHDPKYWKDPEVFDPERFSDENKDNIKPFTFIPFGIGPRNCIGSRFALMEIKSIIFYLLRQFDFIPTAKTQHPIKLNKKTFQMRAENGFWIGLKPRK